jgi:hypothetical protein
MATALSTVARNAAHKRLAELHPEMFAAILAEERVARGLPAVPTIGGEGRVAVERKPTSRVLAKMFRRYAAPELGISPTVWRNWIRLGVPVDRTQDVADMIGLPVAVLWPQLEQPEQPKPKRKARDDVPTHSCECSQTFFTRADLARHRLHTGHGHDEGAP